MFNFTLPHGFKRNLLGFLLLASPLGSQAQGAPVQADQLFLGNSPIDIAVADKKLDFKAMSAEYLKAHGIDSADLTLGDLVDNDSYARLDIGSFELRLPVDVMAKKQMAQRMQDSVHAIVNIQRHWYAWEGSAPPEAEADWITLSKWVASWPVRKMAKIKGGPESLFIQLGAKSKVLEAAERLAAWTEYDGDVAETLGPKNLTILAPTRKHFLLLTAAAGLARPDLKPQLWSDDIVRHGASWVDYQQIIALENFGHPVNWEKPYRGRSLTDSDEHGLKQFVADRVATVLLRKEYFRHGTHFFEEAMGINLTIAYLGLNSNGPPEFDFKYKTAGGSTQPYSRFVPGGNPNGGVLPPRKAQAGPTSFSGNMAAVGTYRANEGSDFFVQPLKDGQKNGHKQAAKQKQPDNYRDKLPHFLLTSLESGESTVISAPFLGEAADGKTLPEHDFLDDYEDFFRAYRSCFFHWLRTKSEGKHSEPRFAALIEAHAVREVGTSLDTVIREVYGVPFSSENADTDSLEFRFLAWLKKGR